MEKERMQVSEETFKKLTEAFKAFSASVEKVKFQVGTIHELSNMLVASNVIQKTNCLIKLHIKLEKANVFTRWYYRRKITKMELIIKGLQLALRKEKTEPIIGITRQIKEM